jgi:prolipoprotein diacylglyceryl transferase
VNRRTSIPSPADGQIDIGPLSIHAYGVLIALGVIAAVWLAGRRLEARGAGTRDDMGAIALWAVGAGIVGARLYHVITDWSSFSGDLGRIPQIWKGGLGIPGGLIAGIAVGLYVGRRRGIRPDVLATVAAPAIPLAQAIGRWGNWFNQELFGRPTDLPWALEVSDQKAVAAGYAPGTTFHPTFLYESLWNLALCGVLLWIDRRFKLRAGALMAVYVIGYGIGRFWVEGLRIDPADQVAGLRWNQWMAVIMVVAGAGYLLWVSGRPKPADAEIDPAGVDPAGVDPAGVDPARVDPDGEELNGADVDPADDAAADDETPSDYVAGDG